MSSTNEDIIITAYSVAGAKPVAPVRASFKTEEGVDAAAYQDALDAFSAEMVAYDQRVKAAAREIKVNLAGDSAIAKQLKALDKALDKESKEGKVFVGTITAVANANNNSKRVTVTLFTNTSLAIPNLPQGYETVSTERIDNPDGRAMAREAQLLIGHRVTAFVELEQFGEGAMQKKSRVLRHLSDSGVNKDYDPATKSVTAS